jgi:hypothetical protein
VSSCAGDFFLVFWHNFEFVHLSRTKKLGMILILKIFWKHVAHEEEMMHPFSSPSITFTLYLHTYDIPWPALFWVLPTFTSDLMYMPCIGSPSKELAKWYYCKYITANSALYYTDKKMPHFRRCLASHHQLRNVPEF